MFLSLKQLVDTYPLQTVRFWGRIYLLIKKYKFLFSGCWITLQLLLLTPPFSWGNATAQNDFQVRVAYLIEFDEEN